MTEYYANKLVEAYHLHTLQGCEYKEIAAFYGYGKAVNDHIRSTFNRFVKVGATYMDVCRFTKEGWGATLKTIECYLRFVGGRGRQLQGRALYEEINPSMSFYDFQCCLRGLALTCPDLVSYTDTHGLDCVDIK